MEGNYSELVDFFVEHLDAIDFDKTRLSYPSKPIVIFCGGEIANADAILLEDVDSTSFTSFRECLKKLHQQYYPRYLFFTPEELNWRDGQVFTDLLEFEIAFSHFSTVVAVITETPGSLVELGVFSSDKLNDDKLLIITDSKFSESQSFINKGVFEYIRDSNNNAVKFFPLNSYKSNIDGSENPIKIPSHLAQDVFEDVNAFVEEKIKSKTCKFNVKNKTHFFSLLIDAIIIFRVLSKEEMVQITEYLNLYLLEDFFGESDVRQFLMLMRELDFIRLHTSGSERLFYFNQDLGSLSRVSFFYKKGKNYDRTRKMSQVIDFYEKRSSASRWERTKVGAIKEIYGHTGGSDDFF